MKSAAPFFIAGTLIGTLLTLQLSSDILPTSSYPLDEYQFQEELVQSFVDEQQELQERLNDLNEQVEEQEEAVGQLYSTVDSDYLQSLKETLGLNEVSGEGVEIILDDSPIVDRDDLWVDSSSLVHAADLRDLVNVLRTLPRTGIAINDQRIVATTSIKNAGNTILVNHFHLIPPFKVTIVTDFPDLVIQKLSSELELSSLYTRVASHGLEFKFKERENLTAPAYIGTYSTDFLTALGDES